VAYRFFNPMFHLVKILVYMLELIYISFIVMFFGRAAKARLRSDVLALLIVLFLLTSCSIFDGPGPGENTPIPGEDPPAIPTLTTIPSPTPEPRVLNVCIGSEPDDLFIYSGRSTAKNHILEAIYDGPIDARGFDFQPVILEKLPDLSDGDAWLEPVNVYQGDWVVNDAGVLVQLIPGEMVRPYGCNQSDCAISWDGDPLQMAQISAEFTLREDIKWSDGMPLTIYDSVFSYEIARQCQIEGIGTCGGNGLIIPNQRTVDNTTAYTPVNENVVRWVGVPGYHDPDYSINFFIPLPEHILGSHSLEELFSINESTQIPLGWGPYYITGWIPGEYIRMYANYNYFRAAEGLPRFDMLIYRFVGSDPDSNLDLLISGVCDVLDQEASQLLGGDKFERTLELQEQVEVVVHTTPSAVWEQLAFGIQPRAYDAGYRIGIDRADFFGDAQTRRALAMCMDRQRIVDEIFLGTTIIPDSFIPPTHPLFNPNVDQIEYNPQAGMSKLDEIGWIDHDDNAGTPRIARGVPNVLDGTEFSLSYFTSSAPSRQQAARILAESLKECGIQINLNILPANEVYAEGPEGPVFGRQFDLAQLAWMTGHQPICNLFTSDEVLGPPQETWMSIGSRQEFEFIYGWGGQNLVGFSNLEYDTACYAALGLLPGQDGYLEAHYRTQEVFVSQLPVVPLYLHTRMVLSLSNIEGIVLDATSASELWNIEEFNRIDR
jgi:peptide/nickel transport system substrate-binding protein